MRGGLPQTAFQVHQRQQRRILLCILPLGKTPHWHTGKKVS